MRASLDLCSYAVIIGSLSSTALDKSLCRRADYPSFFFWRSSHYRACTVTRVEEIFSSRTRNGPARTRDGFIESLMTSMIIAVGTRDTNRVTLPFRKGKKDRDIRIYLFEGKNCIDPLDR